MKDFSDLKRGDLVRNSMSKTVYVVTDNFGGRVTAVRTADLTNPTEWDKLDPKTGDVIK